MDQYVFTEDGEYFIEQVETIADEAPENAGSKSRVLSWLLEEWRKDRK